MEVFELKKNEKFSCLAFEGVSFEKDDPDSVYLGHNTWILQQPPFAIDNHWKEWLGSLNVEHFSKSSLIIISKQKTQNPDIYDNENQFLTTFVYQVWHSLILLDGIPHIDAGMFVSGSFKNEGLDIRSAGKTETYYRPRSVIPARISMDSIENVAPLSKNLIDIWSAKKNFKRLKRGLRAWLRGLHEYHPYDQLHEHVRMLEAVIKPNIGSTKKQFIHRMNLFFDHPNSNKILDEIFEIRSSVEHLNSWDENVSGYSTVELEEVNCLRAYQVQVLCSFLIKKILINASFRQIFSEDQSIDEFWGKQDHEKRKLIGEPLDLEAICQEKFKSTTNKNN